MDEDDPMYVPQPGPLNRSRKAAREKAYWEAKAKLASKLPPISLNHLREARLKRLKETMDKTKCTLPTCPTHGTPPPPPKKDRILIRFNTKFGEDPEQRKWRVLTNGEEKLAHRVDICGVFTTTVTEPISTGEIKHHFLCDGIVVWKDGDVALVVP